MSEFHRIILLADDDEFRVELERELSDRGWVVVGESEASEAAQVIRQDRAACVVVADGTHEKRVRDILPLLDVDFSTPLIAIVESGDVSTTVDAMRLGATTVIEHDDSPRLLEQVVAVIEEAVPRGSGPKRGADVRDVILRSARSPMSPIVDMLPHIGESSLPLLISGESGTGRGLFARTIHAMSDRDGGPFVVVSCSSIAQVLLEPELFGYAQGAFARARRDRRGLLMEADKGTLCLHELGDLPIRLQAKLSDVLRTKRFSPIGSEAEQETDFRVIASTGKNLADEVQNGRFLAELYDQVAQLHIHLPPLRERSDDFSILVEGLLEQQNRANRTAMKGVTRETLSLMEKYDWPGNVRELETLIQRLCILKQVGFIERDDLPAQFRDGDEPAQHLGLYVPSEGMDIAETLERLEAQLLEQALEKTSGNKAQAARLLGLNRTTLVEKVKRLQIETHSNKGQ
jgi:DNA-binding NtrC family response regulator